MLRPIVFGLFAFTFLALLGIWIISGGPRKLVTDTRASFDATISSASEFEDAEFRLPWQPVELFPTIDITEALNFSSEGADTAYRNAYAQSQEEKLRELEAEYDRLRAGASNQRTFGTPSPHMGKVGIAQDTLGVRASDPKAEYLQIAANYSNAEAINISGWTIESALSGSRVQIPLATSMFLSGAANQVGAVSLEPGGLAVISSAASPVGISFRENMCSGYLGQFQSFEPPLADECPSPSQVLPLTEENLRLYGDTCFDVIASMSQCRFPQTLPENVFPACRSFLANTLSYNGCVNENKFRSTFQKNMWRLYLASRGELWRNSHDAIRLLDAEGKTVSVFIY